MSQKRSDKMTRSPIVRGALLTLFAVASLAMAGDEVDYSAPYMVVENGELVTKYPAKDHASGDRSAVADDSVIATDDTGKSGRIWVAAAGLAISALMLVYARRRRASMPDK